MTRSRGAAALLVAHVVFLVLTAWSAATHARPAAPSRVRVEQAHAAELALGRPIAAEDVERRGSAPPLALFSPGAAVAVATMPPVGLAPTAREARRPSSPSSAHASARGPPRST